MTLSPRAQSAILAVCLAILAALYAAAWFGPAVAGDHESGMILVTAKALAAGHGYVADNLPTPVPETHTPPLFPALLALFTLISSLPQWLKVLPILCTVGWLAMTRRLLLKMGATRAGSLMLVALSAASPMVIFLGTNLLPETLFGLLVTAALLLLLDEKPLLAGLAAGLASVTLTPGVALIAACIVTLTVRRRLRPAVLFTAAAVPLPAVWIGWSLAHVTRHAGLNSLVNDAGQAATNILVALPANEKLVVLVRNIDLLFNAPVELLSGLNSMYAAAATALVALWCLWVRRNLLPDLFVLLYGLAVVLLIQPPLQLAAPLLPLVLWMGWRAISRIESSEAVAAIVLITAGVLGYADGVRAPALVVSGMFPATDHAPNDWREMQKLFAFVKEVSSPGSVLLANSEGTWFVNTGRKTVRGFTPNGFSLYYGERHETVKLDQISTAIQEQLVNYVVLTPDREEPESASFHAAVEALERGGVLEPVDSQGLAPGYRLLHVASAGR
jgi:hypothetical protein